MLCYVSLHNVCVRTVCEINNDDELEYVLYFVLMLWRDCI